MAESTKHRNAFERYFRLGAKRSIERLHEAMQAEGDAPSLRTLYGWSSTYGWQDRLAELERKAREAEQEVFIEEIREMDKRHVKEALLLQQKGAEWLVTLDLKAVTLAGAIRAIQVGVMLERKARGSERKIDITQQLREMAIREGLDPDQAVRDAQEIVRSMEG